MKIIKHYSIFFYKYIYFMYRQTAKYMVYPCCKAKKKEEKNPNEMGVQHVGVGLCSDQEVCTY